MGGFTNEELDEFNLGKNYKYPDTTDIEKKAATIIPKISDDNSIFKFTISVLILMGSIFGILSYFKYNNMTIRNFFKNLRDQMNNSGIRVSYKTMVMPK
jgi:hypothetical protein